MTTISVTQRHLDEGFPGACTDCPVALAVEDAFPHVSGVMVGHEYISVDDAGQTALLRIPANVLDAIDAIDRGEPVQPFSFDLDYPEVAA